MLKSISMTLLTSVLLATTANAQDMTSADIVALVKGKTVYLELVGAGPRGKGTAIMFYGEDNKAAAKFPNGTAPKATWSTKGNELCTAWDDQPNNPWSSYVKVGDKINVINSETKQVRGTVVRVVPGNAEKL